jgi:hypothetical protein
LKLALLDLPRLRFLAPKISGGVDDSKHFDSLSDDSIDDAIAPIEYLPDTLALRLRYNTPQIGKVVSCSARVIMLAMKSAA